MGPCQGESNLLFLRRYPQPSNDLLRQVIQIHRLLWLGNPVLVHPGQPQGIVHQGNHPGGFPVNISGKFLHVLRLNHILHQHAGNGVDGGQRRLHLVGYVGGKFPAQLLPMLLLGHIQQQHHNAGHRILLLYGACQHPITVLPQGQKLLRRLSGKCLLHRHAEGLTAIEFVNIPGVGGFRNPEDLQSCRIPA